MKELAMDPEVKDELYGRYQQYGDERASQDLANRKWQSQLHKQLSHKALDEPMMDDEMGDIYAPKTVTNTGISGKGLLALAAIVLPMMGLGGAGAAVILNQMFSQPAPAPVPVPAPAASPAETSGGGTGTVTVPSLQFGPERQ